MSPDDIFAANMWVWPDPLLKRDAMGCILFVNAAFLQLYGGRVENWAGNPIQGWPAPSAQGAPYRFETRIPSPQGEIVYDWVELTMADGNALAIARDVTIFQGPPSQGLPLSHNQAHAPHEAAAQTTADLGTQTAAHYAQAAPQQQAASELATSEQIEPPHTTPQQATSAQAPITPEPVAPAAPLIAETAPISAPVTEAAPIMESPSAEPAASVAPQAIVEPAQPEVAPEPPYQEAAFADAPAPKEPAQPAQTTQAQPERAFERRALPIEDGDAVLGSNWRDAVIARAVGADAEEEPEEAPVSIRAEETVAQTAEPENTAQGLKILLAEDNAINALLTRTLLEAEGCVVETVEDGALAVQAMQDNMYDLIFMDMRMPNMDGLEATRKIRAMGARTAELPIIALTANAFDDDRNACFDSGMNDFMTKPVSAEELSHMVNTWTQKKNEAEAAA